MIVQMGENNTKVGDLEPGAVFLFGTHAYMMTDDKKDCRAVKLEDGSMHFFAAVCNVQEKAAVVTLTDI